MRSFTDLDAAKGYDKGLTVLGAVCAARVCVQVWGAVRLMGTMTAVVLFMGVISVYAAPPESPPPKKRPCRMMCL
jgi:hypothetical protein